jgi:GDPmannose 4,6-dehydratase
MPVALIIGHEGQDGTYLRQMLRRKGYSVVATGRHAVNSDLKGFPVALNITSSKDVHETVRRLQPDEIYFLAAFHHSSEDPAIDTAELVTQSFAINTLAFHNFLSAVAATEHRGKVFYASSSRVFGKPTQPTQNEDTPLNPTCPYGISKEAAMRLAGYYRDRKVYVCCGILYNHESPLRKPQFISRKAVQTAVRISRGSRERLLVGDLNASVDWGYAPDYVNAIWRIMQLDRPEDFVIGSGVVHTVRDLVSAAFRCVGLHWEDHVEENPGFLTQRGVSMPLCADSRKLRERCGWAPTVTFEEMIQIMVKAEISGKRIDVPPGAVN